MVESPLLTIANDASPEVEIGKLSETDLEKFSSLCNAFPELGLAGTWKTNCFAMGRANSSAVFSTICRINHSCQPNCERRWQPDRKVETLYALRDIEPDEELTIVYTNEFRRRSERQAEHQRRWRFTCQCECCQLTGDAQVISDCRRESAYQMRGTVRDWMENQHYRHLLPRMKKAAKFMQDEGFRGSTLATVCYDVCQIATLARDIEVAKVYSKIALEEFVLGTGESSVFSVRMKEINKALQIRHEVDVGLLLEFLNSPDG
jgi:SET domain